MGIASEKKSLMADLHTPANFLPRWRQRARQLKADTYALYLAYRDPRTPWYARLVTACVVAYLFSPIDLIPDFIPVLGYLDDLILVPLGIALAIRLIPAYVLRESRAQAQEALAEEKPRNWAAAVVVIAIWVLLAVIAVAVIVRGVGL